MVAKVKPKLGFPPGYFPLKPKLGFPLKPNHLVITRDHELVITRDHYLVITRDHYLTCVTAQVRQPRRALTATRDHQDNHIRYCGPQL